MDFELHMAIISKLSAIINLALNLSIMLFLHSSCSAYVFRQVDSVKVLLFSLEFNVVVNQI